MPSELVKQKRYDLSLPLKHLKAAYQYLPSSVKRKLQQDFLLLKKSKSSSVAVKTFIDVVNFTMLNNNEFLEKENKASLLFAYTAYSLAGNYLQNKIPLTHQPFLNPLIKQSNNFAQFALDRIYS